ncbi:MAG: nucleotide sugar dehydrogenase [Candidatus Bathyarchaeota archaeon]|nr:nucleotide sugar dehydrogenase [Candidatus Bathyarchaeota archaeon]
MIEKLTQKVSNDVDCMLKQQCTLAVVGTGYVGLPTAALFAQAGFNVTAIDIRESIVARIRKGHSPIQEPGLETIISSHVQSGKLKAELLYSSIFRDKRVIIITVQTPIGVDKKPDLSFLINAIQKIGPELQEGTLVAVCSTLPPGTMHDKIVPLLSRLSGLTPDKDFYLAYVPERIAPGVAIKEFVESPRLVGGIGPNSTLIASSVFRRVCKNIIETDAPTAEISKTAENTFRDVNIAFANQLALICEKHHADVVKVIALANTHTRVNIHLVGPGVGGPCLTKDPYLLIYETIFPNQSIVETARQINDYMPKHMVGLLIDSLKNNGKNVRDSYVTVLGTAYKADVDDSRFTPSEPIIRELLGICKNVSVYDPYCTETFGAKRACSIAEAASGSDCLMILTDHSEFKNLDLSALKSLMNGSPVIVDGRRMLMPDRVLSAGFSYYGVGYGQKHDE